ncbi:MAG: hypothetical protein K2J39_00170 [Ruminococcus sp.]|nr:hypothetical protein [Ruminococcus sp.]
MRALGISCESYISCFGSSSEKLHQMLFCRNAAANTGSSADLSDMAESPVYNITDGFELSARMLALTVYSSTEKFKAKFSSADIESFGISAGCVFGSVKETEIADRKVNEKGLRGISVKNMLNSVPCGSSSKSAIVSCLRGENVINCNGVTASIDSLIYASDRIERGICKGMAAGGTEENNLLVRLASSDLKNVTLSEGAGSVIIHDAACGADCYMLGKGRSFSPENNYSSALISAVSKAIKSIEDSDKKIDLVICGFNSDEESDNARLSAMEYCFVKTGVRCYSAKGIFGEVAGADGILAVIASMEILRSQKFPSDCINIGNVSECSEIKNILIADVDKCGLASCVILGKEIYYG